MFYNLGAWFLKLDAVTINSAMEMTNVGQEIGRIRLVVFFVLHDPEHKVLILKKTSFTLRIVKHWLFHASQLLT